MSARNFAAGIRSTKALAFLGWVFLTAASLCAQSSNGRAKPPAPSSAAPSVVAAQEFPVTMRQNVVAGKTPVGAKVEAKLTMATLVHGTVIPEGAIFSGKVVESSARSAMDPSRLAIRMDSVHWKKESRPITVYLTAWYYPVLMGQDAQTNDQISDRPPMRADTGGFPDPRTAPPSVLPPPSRLSESRVAMKDVDSERDADVAIALTCTKSNIKLDKTTTYVLVTGELAAK